MIRVNFVNADGTSRQARGEAGMSLMELAVQNDIVGILADCGGACSCGTCHVHLDEGWTGAFPVAEDHERGLLEFSPAFQANSRLSCQLVLTEAVDGLVVRIPPV